MSADFDASDYERPPRAASWEETAKTALAELEKLRTDYARGTAHLHAEIDHLRKFLSETEAKLVGAARDRDIYRKAKAENDERYMTERDEARASLAKADARFELLAELVEALRK